MKLLLSTLALLIVNFSAWADVPAYVVIVRSPGITLERQLELFQQGLSKLSEVGKRIKIVQAIGMDDILQKNSLDSYVERGRLWKEVAYSLKYCSRNILCLMVLPPVIDKDGRSYNGGVSGGICTTSRRNASSRYNYSIMREVNDNGLDRTEQSKISAAHEGCHNLGCDHDIRKGHEITIMNPDPLPFVAQGYDLHFNALAKKQVKYCDQGKSPTGRSLRRVHTVVDRVVN